MSPPLRPRLDRDGFPGLTFEKIAREAGENQALIRYHFGNKAGLVNALVDAVFCSEATELIQILTPLAAGDERREALFEKQRRVTVDATTYRRVYELIPNVLRDPQLSLKLRELLRWYRALDAWALVEDDTKQVSTLEPLSVLTAAMLDGLALQVQVDPGLDVGPAFALWERLVLQYLKQQGRFGPCSAEADAG